MKIQSKIKCSKQALKFGSKYKVKHLLLFLNLRMNNLEDLKILKTEGKTDVHKDIDLEILSPQEYLVFGEKEDNFIS